MDVHQKISRIKSVRNLMRPIKRLALILDMDLLTMRSREQLLQIVIVLRDAIRYHRDQRGDDRCWFDDIILYWHLTECPRSPVRASTAEMAKRCEYFYRCRGGHAAPKAATVLDSTGDPNAYLLPMSIGQLRQEISRLRKGVRRHKNRGMDNRRREDDELLYALLHEGIQADFRLPPEPMFLRNCQFICSMVDPNNVDLSKWPNGQTSPLAGWRPTE